MKAFRWFGFLALSIVVSFGGFSHVSGCMDTVAGNTEQGLCDMAGNVIIGLPEIRTTC